MERRRDALVGAARVAVALRDEALSQPEMTANVGMIRVEPGGSNVIPGVCEFTIDVRSPGEEGYRRIESFVRDLLQSVAGEERLELEVRERTRHDPTPLDPGLQAALEQAAELEGARAVRLPSRAAHDAMVLAQHVPAAMLFVPSRAGVSHSPDEFTEDRHCELGARVLARALELLVG
jgi:acetylornithine deacetylase/succinyl-diaminopimelate desuccinylase-like protein